MGNTLETCCSDSRSTDGADRNKNNKLLIGMDTHDSESDEETNV